MTIDVTGNGIIAAYGDKLIIWNVCVQPFSVHKGPQYMAIVSMVKPYLLYHGNDIVQNEGCVSKMDNAFHSGKKTSSVFALLYCMQFG